MEKGELAKGDGRGIDASRTVQDAKLPSSSPVENHGYLSTKNVRDAYSKA